MFKVHQKLAQTILLSHVLSRAGVSIRPRHPLYYAVVKLQRRAWRGQMNQ